MRAPGASTYLYQQNHFGVYRSSDSGSTWEEITGDLPSEFGFPMEVHPHDPATVYVIPLQGDGRHMPDGKAAVWRSRDRGDTWHRLSEGLPQEHAFIGVLREGMAVDTLPVPGVYFGTSTGQIYGSRDEGDTWFQIADFLPRILSISTAVIEA